MTLTLTLTSTLAARTKPNKPPSLAHFLEMHRRGESKAKVKVKGEGEGDASTSGGGWVRVIDEAHLVVEAEIARGSFGVMMKASMNGTQPVALKVQR